MSTALNLIRSIEADGLKTLGQPQDGEHVAMTDSVVTRELLKRVAKPPTRHRLFCIRTYWTLQQDSTFTPRNFVIAVRRRGEFVATALSGDGRFSDSLQS